MVVTTATSQRIATLTYTKDFSPNFEDNNFKLSYFYDKLQQVAKTTKLITLQNFIYKHTINLENVQMHKKRKRRIYKMSS